jgi:hypothetical protein
VYVCDLLELGVTLLDVVLVRLLEVLVEDDVAVGADGVEASLLADGSDLRATQEHKA